MFRVDGALIWPYFHNNYIQQLCLSGWFYFTGSSNADDYNLASDDCCNNFDFCSCRWVVIGKFFRYRSAALGPKRFMKPSYLYKILVIKMIADLAC